MEKSFHNRIGAFEKWIIYYLVLGVVQTLWTNPSTFPPMPLRVGMIIASFGPILFKREIILIAIPFSMTLRGFLSTGYSFLPDVYSYWFYIGIEFLALVIHCKSLNFSWLGKTKVLVLMMLFFALVDMACNGEFGKYTIHIFIGLLLVPFINEDNDFHLLSAAILTVSALLSVYYIVMFDEFLSAWGSTGIERSGWADPNYFSTLLDRGFFVAMMYLLGFCKYDSFVFDKKVLVIICMVISSAVIMTASRAGFLCIAFILVIALFISKLKASQFVLSLLIIVATVVYLYSKGTFELLLYRLLEQGNLYTGGDRTTIWQTMLANFGNQNLINQLFGGGYWHRVELTGGADLHNEFFSVMADYGLIGLVLFVSFIISLSSFSRDDFLRQNVAILFLLLSIISLSPCQSVFIMFFIVWIYALKIYNSNLLNCE